LGDPVAREGQARFGIQTRRALGRDHPAQMEARAAEFDSCGSRQTRPRTTGSTRLRIQANGKGTARWVAADALRELRSEQVVARIPR
jgi:hypothetical protein